jgi:hypothetical protein
MQTDPNWRRNSRTSGAQTRERNQHVDYSNGAPIRNDETYRAATIAPGLWATVEIIEQPAKPQLRNAWQGRQAAAERAAAEQPRTRD